MLLETGSVVHFQAWSWICRDVLREGAWLSNVQEGGLKRNGSASGRTSPARILLGNQQLAARTSKGRVRGDKRRGNHWR